jgi:hypothetical protein
MRCNNNHRITNQHSAISYCVMHDEHTGIIKSLHGHQSGVVGVDIELLIRTVLTISNGCFHGINYT